MVTLSSHPVFSCFNPVEIVCSGNHVYDFLGTKTDCTYHKGMIAPEKGYRLKTKIPVVNEHYPDWIAVLEAVLASEDSFTMFELGAGWAPWLIRAAFAMKQKFPDKKFNLIGVEGDKTHFKWMKEHFSVNHINPSEHILINALVAGKDGTALFPALTKPDEDYGASFVSSPDQYTYQRGELIEMKTVSVNTLIQMVRKPIDFMHIDIQGAEYEAIPPAIDLVNDKVKMIMIGTHRSPLLHEEIKLFMFGMKWMPRYLFDRNSEWITEWGKIKFDDGFQLWVNPKFIDN